MGRMSELQIALEQGDLSGEAREIVRRLDQLRSDARTAGASWLGTGILLDSAINDVRGAAAELERYEQTYRREREQRENETRCEI